MARFALALTVFLAFTVYSFDILFAEGIGPVFAILLGGGWGQQIFLDLIVASVISTFWLVPDAKKHGLPAWPFLVVLPFVGSIATLAYVVAREWRRLRAPAP